jgi:hypothetical protein
VADFVDEMVLLDTGSSRSASLRTIIERLSCIGPALSR